jgi:hypothetical protein
MTRWRFDSVQRCTILESIPAFATFYNVESSHLFVLSMLQRPLHGDIKELYQGPVHGEGDAKALLEEALPPCTARAFPRVTAQTGIGARSLFWVCFPRHSCPSFSCMLTAFSVDTWRRSLFERH